MSQPPDWLPEDVGAGVDAVEPGAARRYDVHPRSRAGGAPTAETELVEPGLVHLPEWRPDAAEDRWENPETSLLYAAVGRKV